MAKRSSDLRFFFFFFFFKDRSGGGRGEGGWGILLNVDLTPRKPTPKSKFTGTGPSASCEYC